ncbi:MAG: hypothetical protein P1U32_08100, partial [Legionellaceae bacterium]|nr:hypothetical protein [Legionellaceae bacterium]
MALSDLINDIESSVGSFTSGYLLSNRQPAETLSFTQKPAQQFLAKLGCNNRPDANLSSHPAGPL